MSVIIPRKQKWISAQNIGEQQLQQQQQQGWEYRHVLFHDDLDIVRIETLQQFVETIAPWVETIGTSPDGVNDETLNVILSGMIRRPCGAPPPTCRRLKKLSIRDPWRRTTNGDMVLSCVRSMSSLEILELDGVRISSVETVDQFFASCRNLKELELNSIEVEGDDDELATEELAYAFRNGLERNESLMRIRMINIADGPFLHEMLLGLTGNRHVQELLLEPPAGSLSKQALDMIQTLVSNSVSIQTLHFVGDTPLVEVFLGLAFNSTVHTFLCEISGMRLVVASADERLQGAIRQCVAHNRTLRVCQMRGNNGSFGPRARAALARGLSRWESLEELDVDGAHPVLSPDVVEHLARLRRVSLPRVLSTADWRLLSRGMPHNERNGNNLQVLNLSYNPLTSQDLALILPSLGSISELSLQHCHISYESVPQLCDFVRTTSFLKKLDLGFNQIGSQGAADLFTTVSTSTSMEQLNVQGPECNHLGNNNNDSNQHHKVTMIDLNECHESLRTLLSGGSQLVSLNLTHYTPLGADSIQSLAAGIQENESSLLQDIKLPWLDLEFISLLGETLTTKPSLKYLQVNAANRVVRREADGELMFKALGEVEEEAVLSFIGQLPRMTSLIRIKSVFDFQPSERLNEAFVAALKQNTTLKELQGNVRLAEKYTNHIYNNETVQFYLELNRLGRHHYLAAPESKPILPAILPCLFARMAQPEYVSHLYYFLRRTSPDVLAASKKMPGSQKRKATTTTTTTASLRDDNWYSRRDKLM